MSGPNSKDPLGVHARGRMELMAAMPVPITITATVQGSNLPFNMGGEHANSTSRHEWIDLRLEPERIAELPEVRRHPQWESILRTINGANTPFQTIGCNCTIRENEPLITINGISSATLIPQPWQARSYVQVGVAGDLAFDSLDTLYMLSGRLMAYLTNRAIPLADTYDSGDYHIILAFELLMRHRQPAGYVLCVRCRVAGTSSDHAIERWSVIMNEIAGFFATWKREQDSGPNENTPPDEPTG